MTYSNYDEILEESELCMKKSPRAKNCDECGKQEDCFNDKWQIILPIVPIKPEKLFYKKKYNRKDILCSIKGMVHLLELDLDKEATGKTLMITSDLLRMVFVYEDISIEDSYKQYEKTMEGENNG